MLPFILQGMSFSVTAVLVSYNRAKLLRECLDALEVQTRRPDRIVVVDNASNDDSVDVIRQHNLEVDLIRLKRNTGGAGGFTAGIAAAIVGIPATPDSYLWLMDDDVVPKPEALEKLMLAVVQAHVTNGVWPVAMGSEALWTDGRVHRMNKPRKRFPIRRGAAGLRSSVGSYQVRSLSFVSCLLNAQAIKASRSLPKAAFFLWNDDFEFTSRLLKRGVGYYVPASEVWHKTKVFGSSDADPGPRFFYEVRNKIWMFRFCRRDFTAFELPVLFVATCRRWVLTLVRAHDRRQILHSLRSGLKAGLGSVPASNRELFSFDPRIQTMITEVES